MQLLGNLKALAEKDGHNVEVFDTWLATRAEASVDLGLDDLSLDDLSIGADDAETADAEPQVAVG